MKTTYRKYSQDSVIEIHRNPAATCKFEDVEVVSRAQPEPTPQNNMVEGLYCLQSIPTGTLKPVPFEPDGRKLLDVVFKRVQDVWGDTQPDVIKDWQNWVDNVVPQSDDVTEFIAAKPHEYRIPLLDSLFADDDPELRRALPVQQIRRRRAYRATASVNWTNRGNKRANHDSAINSALEQISEESFLCANTSTILNDDSVPVGNLNVSAKSSQPTKPVANETTKLTTKRKTMSSKSRRPKRTCFDSSDDTEDSSESDTSEDVQDAMAPETDSNAEEGGYIICYNPHHIPRMGESSYYIGRTFTVPEKYVEKVEFARECATGKVVAVVRKPEDPNTYYYKFYNYVKHRTPPRVGSHDWFYEKCAVMMSHQEKTRKIMWDANEDGKDRKKPAKPRQKRRTWAFENVPPALYDEEK